MSLGADVADHISAPGLLKKLPECSTLFILFTTITLKNI